MTQKYSSIVISAVGVAAALTEEATILKAIFERVDHSLSKSCLRLRHILSSQILKNCIAQSLNCLIDLFTHFVLTLLLID